MVAPLAALATDQQEVGPAHAYRQAPLGDHTYARRAALREQIAEAEMPEVDPLLLLSRA
jgi:hypothetical protein